MEEVGKTTETSPRPSRQLAAIMFADMTGYTAMMQEDEKRANTLREKQKKTLELYIPFHHGKILQYFGDGTLSLFDSAIDAVKSAIDIQYELQKDPKVALRIGIHSGDVIYDHEGVYGDCVNIASRIEALSAPGGVLVSEKVFDEIKNQPDIKTVSLGKFSLKNVKKQLEVFAITNEDLVVPTPSQVGVKSGNDKSIAVLPFINMSADPENEYFSDGISEEILNALTKVEGLQVTARSSSFFFKGKNEDIRQVGSTLGVANVLSGSVRKAGKRIRITAQLTNTIDGYLVWSDVYDSDLEDIFDVQDEISLKILNKLKENFARDAKESQLIKAPTENLDAYNFFLKGLYHWNKSNPEDIIKAIKNYEEAIKMDPKFARAYCTLSYCYTFLGSSGLMSPLEAYPRAKDFTLKAIELEPDHAESHLSLATIKFYHNWDFEGAGISFSKAASLNLNSSLFNQVYGWYLIAIGEFEQAIEKMKQALVLDPLTLPLMTNLADAYSFGGYFDEALEQYDKAIEMDPQFRRAYEGKGMVHLVTGNHVKAIENLKQYHKLIGHPLKGLASLGHAYAIAGHHDKALECLEKIKQREELEPDKLFHMDYAFVYAGMGDYEKAFHYLNKTYDQRLGVACLGMIFCIRYPMLKGLRSDKRFVELLEKMKLS